MKHKNYRNPPISEAICQFDFVEPLAWTVVTPALVYQKLASDYPLEPDQQEQVQAVFQPASEGASPEFSINRLANRYLYRDETQSRIVTLAQNSIGVNSLRPYEGWLALRTRASQSLKMVGEVMPIPEIGQVSLRYINQIRLGDGSTELSDYIAVPVLAAAFEGAAIGAFVSRTESLLVDGTRVSVTFASVAPPPDDAEASYVILDIDCKRQFDAPLDADGALNAADELKTVENQQFEALITDECRRLFE